VVIWYIFPRFGIGCQEKSGNPDVDRHNAFERFSENFFSRCNFETIFTFGLKCVFQSA
jgi:hypothetical protein